MNENLREAHEPVYLEGSKGRLFAMYSNPRATRDTGEDLIYLPPFAEEMNRSRALISRLARSLAECGIGVLVLDLFGTGDSEGEFADARWSIWLNDIDIAAEWIRRRGRRLRGLWGLRLGGLLAAQHMAMNPERVRYALLWQPVLDGKTFMTQFLRLRVAAAMGTPGVRESVSGLRARLAFGEALEIAGYMIHPELVATLDSVRIDAYRFAKDARLDWIDVQEEENAVASHSRGKQLIDTWRGEGVTASISNVTGAPFWLIEEPVPAPALFNATRGLLGFQ